ncbi:MAG: response regulator [Acidobacteria bacterium]|nr:response regulator [Acidobacteriota bacterium]
MAKILVVDDELDVLETVTYRLEQAGHEVETSADGIQALGMVRAEQPDLLILDVMLPGENGYRVAHYLREDESAGVYPRRLPIILLTARDLSAEPDREKMFMNFSGADRVIYKPFDLDDLVRQVNELLE